MSLQITEFSGNCPKNVSRDAKYAVRSSPSGQVIGLLYRNINGEQWRATTKDHPLLAAMVNAVKVTKGDATNGPFYINEYSQVIVPAGPDARYYLVGEYHDPVEFKFEGNELSGRGVGLDGHPFEPGDIWTGPHPGIPYVLKAGGADIYYKSTPRVNVTKKEWLSSHIGADEARVLASRIQEVKGWSGGRFYVNEWQEIFTPVNTPDALNYVYIGHLDLDDDRWFPKPNPGA